MKVKALLLGLVLAVSAGSAQAALIVTLSKHGINDVLASFVGSGVTANTSSVATKANLGAPFQVNGQAAFTVDPITIAGQQITQMGFDDDGGVGDDWSIHFAGLIAAGTAYNVNASTLLTNVQFTDLVPGTYAGGVQIGVDFGGQTLIISDTAPPPPPPSNVPAPAGVLMLGFALVAMGIQRRRSMS